jgi:Carboxypeptidase regulatory-like domain
MKTNLQHLTFLIHKTKAVLSICLLLVGGALAAQVTTSSFSGRVTDAAGEGLIGATVRATHEPSGSVYGAVTNESGRYFMPAVRVGGPFSLTVTYTGFEAQTRSGLVATLGAATNVTFILRDNATTIEEVVITGNRNDIFSSGRTGATQTFDNKAIVAVPIIGARSINSITKYNPNGNGRSFGGQDSRLNNFTIDGSVFNNGFGLGPGAQAGARTNSTAISLDAIEELQVNVAPFDVRQSGFTGAGINAITKSGTNDFKGTVYYNFRNNDTTFFNGTKAKERKVNVTKFNESVIGATVGGPIIKNKLFFFLSAETQTKSEPATAFVAKGSALAGVATRVEAADLAEVSRIMKDKYGYETGAYEGFNRDINSGKFLVRLDYNLNEKNKVTLRYTHHNSDSEELISNSTAIGNGNRINVNSMSFENSGYIIQDNTRSIVAELNSTLNDKLHNNFIVGYDKQIEDRRYRSAIFPTIDILKDGNTYISTGMDPFTPNNLLNYGTFHVTNNMSIYANKHVFTVGANYEYYKSNNSFFAGSNSAYVFNSLADFKKSAANPGDTSVTLNRFQIRYSLLPNGALPYQILEAHKTDLYGQDEFSIADNFKLTFGVRASLINFGNTALENTLVGGLNFVTQEDSSVYKVNTGKLPGAKLVWEPRLGFNYDVFKNKRTQVRGGTGLFTGRPPYVFLSNQIGNNGVLNNLVNIQNTKAYPFNPSPAAYVPTDPKAPTTSIDIASTDANFKYPQVWKTNLAVDQKITDYLIGSVELLYNKNINAVNYFNANLPVPSTQFAGPDTRPRFTTNRVNSVISNAVILNNASQGAYSAATLKLEFPRRKGFYGMLAYTASNTTDLLSAGSIAATSWTGARSVGGNNNLDLAYSDNHTPHRVIGLVNYRLSYGGKFGGATELSLGYVGSRSVANSYTYAGDMNGDGVSNNDLLFVPLKGSDLVWQTATIINGKDTVRYDAAAQATAFDAFIDQDEHLKTRRGKYAERNGIIFPWLNQLDLGIMQEVGIMAGGKRNALQFRFDILNFGNLLSSNWGVGNVVNQQNPLTYRTTNATTGIPEYRINTQVGADGRIVPVTNTFRSRNTLDDVWQAQVSIRYLFNQ